MSWRLGCFCKTNLFLRKTLRVRSGYDVRIWCMWARTVGIV